MTAGTYTALKLKEELSAAISPRDAAEIRTLRQLQKLCQDGYIEDVVQGRHAAPSWAAKNAMLELTQYTIEDYDRAQEDGIDLLAGAFRSDGALSQTAITYLIEHNEAATRAATKNAHRAAPLRDTEEEPF